MITKERYSF